jgi:uncharacterized protein
MRIFLDANVLFSAARSDGPMRALLHRLNAVGHALVADAYVVAEARRNVAAKCAAPATADLEKLLAALDQTNTHAQLRERPDPATMDWLPRKDQPVLSAAIALRCDVLVTGDKTHFGSGYGKRFAGVEVLSPAMLAARLL